MDEGHWIEQLDHNHDVVRVFCAGGRYLFRVVPHKNRTWRAEHRGGGLWNPLRQAPRGPYRASPTRWWRSPQAAMKAVELLMPSHEKETGK